MEGHHLSETQAFDHLQSISRHNVKLRDVAAEVIYIGDVPLPGCRGTCGRRGTRKRLDLT